MRNLDRTLVSCVAAFVGLFVVTGTGGAAADSLVQGNGGQLCTLTAPGVGQPGTVLCKDVLSGMTTQSVGVGPTLAGPGGIAGNLIRQGPRVLVTNQSQGAVLFALSGGQLASPVTLDTNAEGSLSGALGDQGAYVLTGMRLLFFPKGETMAGSSQSLLVADGSAAQVVLAGRHAYVSEKSGSLEAFALGRDGNLRGPATAVDGIPAGVIVGITSAQDLVVAPIAHLASNPNQSSVPVVRGTGVVQLVPTKEVAACWAAHEDGEVCITNPGSMTVSCGHLGSGAFTSYTGAAATLTGDTVFDIDMMNDVVGILGKAGGAPMLFTFSRNDRSGDFMYAIGQFSLGTTSATGALLLPALP